MPIAWHPSRWWDWCVPNDEKNNRKIVGISMGFFVSGERIQKFFLTQKELMSSVMPFVFNAIELCVVTINKKP